MKREELIKLLTGPFYERFAARLARRVREEGSAALLYRIAVEPHDGLSAADLHKVRFRSAYVLEKIFFERPELFEPHADAFCRADFAACADASARRHFGKIMAHLLPQRNPPAEALERIAEAAAQWTLEPDAKVSVKVWSVEVLKYCRGRVGWVAETWDDLLEALDRDASPGIACRLKKSWKRE